MDDERNCYNHYDGGEKYHIPGCMGCAVSGHDACTCDTLDNKSKSELKRLVRKLEKKLNKLQE